MESVIDVDLFSGADGWRTGMLLLEDPPYPSIGLEWDEWAAKTAVEAGHPTDVVDIAATPTGAYGPIRGLIGSPPCQAWSAAGKGLGKLDRPKIMQHLEWVRAAGEWLDYYPSEGWADPRSPLILEVARWALEQRPEWIALEQVPQVLDFWRVFAEILRAHGYSVDCGVLSAEQYGVPQTRKRAILVASRVREVHLPVPTHCKYQKGKPNGWQAGVLPYVTMAEALGFGLVQRPYPTVAPGTGGGGKDPGMLGGTGARSAVEEAYLAGQWVPRPDGAPVLRFRQSMQAKATMRDVDEPAPTIAFGNDMASATWGTGELDAWMVERRISVEEAGVLQSFPRDYPWQGKVTMQYQQVGNAIPAVLAAAILREVL